MTVIPELKNSKQQRKEGGNENCQTNNPARLRQDQSAERIFVNKDCSLNQNKRQYDPEYNKINNYDNPLFHLLLRCSKTDTARPSGTSAGGSFPGRGLILSAKHTGQMRPLRTVASGQ